MGLCSTQFLTPRANQTCSMMCLISAQTRQEGIKCTKANIRSYCPNLYGGHRLFGMFRNSKIGQLEVWRKKEQQEEELQR